VVADGGDNYGGGGGGGGELRRMSPVSSLAKVKVEHLWLQLPK